MKSMCDKLKNLLLTLLALIMLAGFAVAVPSPDLNPDAQEAYMNAGPADEDDEYAFLFE